MPQGAGNDEWYWCIIYIMQSKGLTEQTRLPVRDEVAEQSILIVHSEANAALVC